MFRDRVRRSATRGLEAKPWCLWHVSPTHANWWRRGTTRCECGACNIAARFRGEGPVRSAPRHCCYPVSAGVGTFVRLASGRRRRQRGLACVRRRRRRRRRRERTEGEYGSRTQVQGRGRRRAGSQAVRQGKKKDKRCTSLAVM